MKASSDRQPFCCQNILGTIYISILHKILSGCHSQLPDLEVHGAKKALAPTITTPPRGRGDSRGHISH